MSQPAPPSVSQPEKPAEPMPIPVPPESQQKVPQQKKMAGTALLLSLSTLLSRVLGLVREQVFAALLGAGFYGDAFATAFRLPNLLRDLFAEGALSAAFQPAFLSARKQRGLSQAQHLANVVATGLLLVVSGLVLFGVVFAPALVDSWATGFSSVAGKAELTVNLTRIMMPFLLLVSLAALAMGMLNAEGRFAPPALAPALFNVATVVTGLSLWAFGIGPSRFAATAWAIATLVGGLLQLGLQLVPLFRMGYRFRPSVDFRNPAFLSVLKTMAPATIGLLATQVNIYISTKFASTEQGATAWLYYAFRLLQLPIGMFGVAVGTVALQRAADSASETDLAQALAGVRDTLTRGLRLVTFYSLPTAVVFYLLAEPILSVVYQRGAFSAHDTLSVAVALRDYAVGLVFYAAVKVVVPVFYALRRARLPVLATVVTVTVSVLFNLALHPLYGYRVLALGTSVGAAVNVLLLLVFFERRFGGVWTAQQLLAYARMAVASLGMGVFLWFAAPILMGAVARTETYGNAPAQVPLLRSVLSLFVLLGLSGGVYVGLCGLFRVSELDDLWQAMRRRINKQTT